MRALRNACCGIVLAVSAAAANAQTAADQLAEVVTVLMLPAGFEGSFGDWQQIEAATQIRWQALPPNMLDDALPDGAYFTRRGLANLGGQPFGVVATGARTMVMNVYFRNVGTSPVGAAAVASALRRQGYTLQAVRCPLKGVAACTQWWRITGRDRRPAFWNSQTDCNGRKCESYALLLDTTLPSLTPEQQRLYTDRCDNDATGGASAAGAAAAPKAGAWDEQLASLFRSLIPSGSTAPVAWSAIDKTPSVSWAPLPPQQMPSPPWPDTENHYYRGGQADLGGRVLYLNATGSASTVLNVHVEDQSTQANRGDVLQALQRQGLTVQLARCGIVYQLSTSRWYRVTGAATRPVMLLRNVRCDTTACPKGQENYTLALSGVLPPLKPGEVDAVAGRCPGR
jgi:hypothetical protein